MENTLEPNKLDAINSILKDLPKTPIVEVTLPSKNKFYQLIDPAKPITIRAMEWTDEQAILSAKGVNSLNILLSRTVSNVNFTELLPIDKLALLLKLREISISNSYTAVIKCPHCAASSEIEQDLSDLPVKPVSDAITDPVAFKLPSIGKEIKVRLQRTKDETYFSKPEMIFNNLWRCIESIDGTTDKQIIAEVVKQLPLRDLKLILRFISLQDYGIELKFNFVCSECEAESIMEMPIGDDFFTMK
jgi:hypothetical protein